MTRSRANRRWLWVTLLVSPFLFTSCVSRWSRDVSVGSLHFEKLRQVENGTRIGKISDSIICDGVLCLPGWTNFYDDWSLKSCVLGSALSVGNREIPIGAWVEFDPAGNVKTVAFPSDTQVQGYWCIGTKGNQMGAHTGFYPSGRLRYFFCPQDVWIDGIPCNGGSFSLIELYESGRFRQCRLSESVEMNGRTYQKRETVELSCDGELVETNE